jgi:hypothetical protein
LKSLTLLEYEQLVSRSVVLEQDRHGLKVLATDDGLIVKIFRQKRLISSALFKSYASRFVANARALKAVGINTVDVLGVSYCKPIKRTLVFYRPIPGKTLREVLQSRVDNDDIMEAFIAFLAELHDKGVYFRSIHLNNVIVTDRSDALGLIDFADMKVGSKSLSRDARLRNFRHLTRYKADQESIKSFGVARFMDLYFESSCLPVLNKHEFLATMQALVTSEGKV